MFLVVTPVLPETDFDGSLLGGLRPHNFERPFKPHIRRCAPKCYTCAAVMLKSVFRSSLVPSDNTSYVNGVKGIPANYSKFLDHTFVLVCIFA